ncbi:thiopurine S-methyltransferase-like [Montipora capricornis]|uniref:thiopurine S-methyltransferase-like n=1 Tax=Montipora capricornis TaxID=246305 RepID=UPI0035F13EAD
MAPKANKRNDSVPQTKKTENKREDPEYIKTVDPILMKHIRELTAGRSNLRIFVPMCGKTHDILWLAEQGHTITGAEMNPRYIRAFFRDAELEYKLRSEQITPKTKFNIYDANDKDITLYQCDIFDLLVNILGQFDAIWDQSSLPVINEMGAKRLKEYTNVMQALLKPDGRHMVEVCKHGANFVLLCRKRTKTYVKTA